MLDVYGKTNEREHTTRTHGLSSAVSTSFLRIAVTPGSSAAPVADVTGVSSCSEDDDDGRRNDAENFMIALLRRRRSSLVRTHALVHACL